MTNRKQKKQLINYFLIAINILLILCFQGCASIKNINSDKPFFFVQLSDPQIGFYPDSIKKEIAAYEKAVADVNQLRPAFVVITGDLVNKARDKDQLAEFKRITSMIDRNIPVYYTPGNHDVGNNPTQSDIDFYNSIYGYDRFSFEHNGSLFIGFNSSLIKVNTPKVEKEQYDWLENELKKGKKAVHIILFCHIPFFINKPDEPDLYYDSGKTEGRNIEMVERKKYLSLLEKYHVNAVFAGHLHQNSYGEYKNIQMVTTSAIGESLGKDPEGFQIITVNKKRIAHQYYNLDSIPTHINLMD